MEGGWGGGGGGGGGTGGRVGVTHATYECAVLWGCSGLAPWQTELWRAASCLLFVILNFCLSCNALSLVFACTLAWDG
jgi:hypothetical protein